MDNIYIFSGMDGCLYTKSDCLKWYLELLTSGDISIEDYPSFASYYDSFFAMGEPNYIVQPFDYSILGYRVFVKPNEDDFYIFPEDFNEVVEWGITFNEVIEFKKDVETEVI